MNNDIKKNETTLDSETHSVEMENYSKNPIMKNRKEITEEISTGDTKFTEDADESSESEEPSDEIMDTRETTPRHLEDKELARYQDILSQSIKIKIRDEYATIYFNCLATQSNASVLLVYKLVSILCTVDVSNQAEEPTDFAQLTVHFLTKSYAFSRIPNGPNKREGKSSERDILISRLIDRTIRPMIHGSFQKVAQLICTLLSHHTTTTSTDIDIEFLSVLASVAAVQLSSIPLIKTPFGCRIGMKENDFIFCPYIRELQRSPLDLFLSFAGDDLIMMECEAKNVEKEVIVKAVSFARQKKVEIEEALFSIHQFGKTKLELHQESRKIQRVAKVRYGKAIEKLLEIPYKTERNSKFQSLQAKIISEMMDEDFDLSKEEISKAFFLNKKRAMRDKIFNTGIRIDGRQITEIRNVSARMNVPFMPSSHGSALFCRGQTNALVSVILGTSYDEQTVDGFETDKKERFILHYTFPPYATGETSQLKTPNRREVGHAKLAFKALKNFIPDKNIFPYTVRVSSEVLSCDGSSSMATICGATLAMIDAGVPLNRCIAGIAIGVVIHPTNQEEILLLSDLIGDEDHLGDMDFKVAGTTEGITALQMDVKEFGIKNDQVLSDILERGSEGIKHIIGIMNEEIEIQKSVIKKHTPLIFRMTVDKNQAKIIIGNRGDTIRTLSEMSGARIDVDSSTCVISIFANNSNSINKAKQMIEDLILQAEVGKIYDDGIVEKITDFGVFVKFLDNKMRGLIHEKNCENERYAYHNWKKCLCVGNKTKIRVVFISADGKIGLAPIFSDEKLENDSNNKPEPHSKNENQEIYNKKFKSDSEQGNRIAELNEESSDMIIQGELEDKNSQNKNFNQRINKPKPFIKPIVTGIKEAPIQELDIKPEITKINETTEDFRKDEKYHCNFF